MKQFLFLLGGMILFIAAFVGVITFFTDRSRFPSTVVIGPDCAQPCWYGIQPGKTTYQQVMNIFEKVDVVDPSSQTESMRDGQVSVIRWGFQEPTGDMAGYINLENGTVEAITIVTGKTLNLQEAFQRYGLPEKIWTYQSKVDLQVVMIYPSKGYIVESDLDLPDRGSTVALSPKSRVMHVTYFNPARFDELIGTAWLIGQPVIVHPADLRPWPGFGPLPLQPAAPQ